MTKKEKIKTPKAKAVGINHVALEVGDIDQALTFYGRFLDFEIQSSSETAAFIYFGDQFINFSKYSRVNYLNYPVINDLAYPWFSKPCIEYLENIDFLILIRSIIRSIIS